MKETKSVPLINPPLWHNQRVDSLTLKEPTGDNYITIGDPQLWVRAKDGGMVLVADDEKVKAYADICIVHEAGADILKLVSLADAMEIRDTILGFFTAAHKARSPTISTSSSST